MAFDLSKEEREKLLERFPVTDAELDQLLLLAHAYDDAHPSQCFLEVPAVKDRLTSKPVCRKLVRENFGNLLEATRRNVFLLAFSEGDDLFPTAQFLEAAMVLLGRRGDGSVERALWEGGKVTLDGASPTAEALAAWIYGLVVAVQELSAPYVPTEDKGGHAAPKAWVSSLALRADSSVSSPVFRQWLTEVAPTLHFVLSTFSHLFLLGTTERLSCPWSLPTPPKANGANGSLPSCTVLSKTSTAVPLVAMGLHGYLWKSLYHSTEQGLSFHTLQSYLTSFFGPTILIMRSTKGDILGYYTEIPWKITSSTTAATVMQEMSDGKDAFLFTLHPVWRRYGRTHEEPKGRTVQYLHGTQEKTAKLPGLSVDGVAEDTPRLHITTTLDGCKAVKIGRSFQDGHLLCSEDDLFFDMEEIQFYAVAPDVSTMVTGDEIGQRAVETKEALRQKLAQVDKTQFVDDLIFMPGHLFEHREQTRGRAEFVAEEEDGRGYYIEEKPPSPRRFSGSK